MNNRKRPEKKPGFNTFKVSLPDDIKILLKVMAAKSRLTMGEFLARNLSALWRFAEDHGHQLFEDPYLNPSPPISRLLADLDLNELVEEIHLPIERLEALAAGDRPTDTDLSFLVASEWIPYTLPQLFRSVQLQFDSVEGTQNVFK